MTEASTPQRPKPRSPPPRRPRAALAVLSSLAIVALLITAVRYAPLTTWGRTFVAQRLNGLDLGALGHLRVRGLSGDVWRRFSVAQLSIADRTGVWIDARNVQVDWRPSALLLRRVEIVSASSPDVTALRDPDIAAQPPASSATLPVTVQIDHADARLTLAPALAVQRGVYDVAGAVTIDRLGALRGALRAVSRLHRGDFATARFDIGREDRLALDVSAHEAKGGALSGALGFSSDQPFDIAVHAQGRGKVGRFSLATDVGATRPAEASGSWDAGGGGAQGHFDLATSRRLSDFRTMFGPQVRFTVTGHAVKAGMYATNLNLSADNIKVNARGNIDPARQATDPRGVVIDTRIVDTSKFSGVAGLGESRFHGTLQGRTAQWILGGDSAIDHVVVGDYSLSRASGPIKLAFNDKALTLQATARGVGGGGHDVLAALLGAIPTALVEVTWLSDGRALIRKLSIDGAGAKINAQGRQGLLGGLSFTGDAVLNRLDAAQAGARGAITATWTADQGRGADHWTFAFDAKGQGLSTGSADLDRLIGATPRLTAQGEYAGGDVSISKSNLVAAVGAVSAVGLVSGAGVVKLALDWHADGPLTLGPIDITGSAKGSGALTGTLTTPRADLTADFKGVDLPYLPLQNAHMILSFVNNAQGPDGRFSMTGASDFGPAKATAGFRFVDQGLDIGDLDIDAGGVVARGSLALRNQTASAADLVVTLGAGAFLDGGHATAKIYIVGPPGGARATLTATAADAVLRDGGGSIKTLSLAADGPLKHLAYSAKGSGMVGDRPWRLAGTGVFAQGVDDRTLSFAGGARFMRADIRTTNPATILFNSNGLEAHLNLASGGGLADVTINRDHDALSASATLENLSLSLFDPDYIGRLDGAMRVAGRGGALGGTLDARLTGAGGRDLKGSPPLDGTLRATLAGPSLTIVADLANSLGSKAHIDLLLPAETSASNFRIAVNRTRAMSGHFVVDGEVRPLWDLGMGGGRSLSGHLVANGSLGGTLADPRAVGTAALTAGRFQDSDTGLKLEGIALAANLLDNSIDVTEFSGRDGGRGTLSGSGRISLARQGVSSFRLDLRGFRLIDNDIGQATASGDISVNRTADGKVRLAGELAVDHAQIAPNPPVPSGVVPMEVIEVHRPIALDEPVVPVGAREAPVDLNIKLKAPGRVFIRGRGLNVELSLDAQVTGTTADPRLSGVAHVVRGDYDFAGRRFQFDDRGVVYLGSTPETIRLDLTASRDDPTLTAVIKIGGTAARPTVTLSSTPVLPKDEVLSRVLFGASAAQLSGLQAAQLASALSGLAGGGGFDIIGGLRNLAHLDRLAVSGDVTTGTSVSGGKYLTDKVYLELSGGGREGPGAQVEWRVRRHLALVSKVTSQGGSQISVRWRRN